MKKKHKALFKGSRKAIIAKAAKMAEQNEAMAVHLDAAVGEIEVQKHSLRRLNDELARFGGVRDDYRTDSLRVELCLSKNEIRHNRMRRDDFARMIADRLCSQIFNA